MASKKVKHERERRKMVSYVDEDILIPILLGGTPYLEGAPGEAYILIKKRRATRDSSKLLPERYSTEIQDTLKNYNERLRIIENKISEIGSYLELNNTGDCDNSPEEPKKTIWQNIEERIDKKMKEYEARINENIQNAFKALEARLNENLNSILKELREIKEKSTKPEIKEAAPSSIENKIGVEKRSQLSSEEDLEKKASKYEMEPDAISRGEFESLWVKTKDAINENKEEISKLIEYERRKKVRHTNICQLYLLQSFTL